MYACQPLGTEADFCFFNGYRFLIKARKSPYRYETIAEELAEQIRAGRFSPGDKIPGTRVLAENFGVSINTVLQVQKLLENRGLIEAVQRSGFYVKRQVTAIAELEPSRRPTPLKPALVRHQRLTLDMIQDSDHEGVLQLGTGMPHPSFFPSRELNRIAARIARDNDDVFDHYELPPGLPALRHSLAQRMQGFGCRVDASEVLVTNGCFEALTLALKSVTEPNDVILMESPSYYGLLQVIDSLDLQAIPIPSHPETGISLGEVRKACEKWPVKACLVVSNFSTPQGNCPDDEQKQALLNLLSECRVPLVEDDVFGDLTFGGGRPAPYKKFDSKGEVLYCSSFSKTVAPGLRVGWLLPGRYLEKATYLKFAHNIATSALNQMVLDEYLRKGNVDRHIRKVRQIYATNIAQTIDLIQQVFPPDTKTSNPLGGFTLWVKLPERFDTAELYRQALAENIFIAPDKLFSNDRRFHSFIRINCAHPWDPVLKPAIITLGQLLQP